MNAEKTFNVRGAKVYPVAFVTGRQPSNHLGSVKLGFTTGNGQHLLVYMTDLEAKMLAASLYAASDDAGDKQPV